MREGGGGEGREGGREGEGREGGREGERVEVMDNTKEQVNQEWKRFEREIVNSPRS